MNWVVPVDLLWILVRVRLVWYSSSWHFFSYADEDAVSDNTGDPGNSAPFSVTFPSPE